MDNKETAEKESKYLEETLDAAIKFIEGLKALSDKVNLEDIRNYYLNGITGNGISDELYEEGKKLFELREKAISEEMHSKGISQAEKANIRLPEDILSGRFLGTGFSQELMRKIPILSVYSIFVPYTSEEIHKRQMLWTGRPKSERI